MLFLFGLLLFLGFQFKSVLQPVYEMIGDVLGWAANLINDEINRRKQL